MIPESSIPDTLVYLREAVRQLEERLYRSLDHWAQEREAAFGELFLPELAAPLPTVRLVEFAPQAPGVTFPRNSVLQPSGIPDDGPLVLWRTVYPVATWPLRLECAEFIRQTVFPCLPLAGERARSALRLVLEVIPGFGEVPLGEWDGFDRVTFHLDGLPEQMHPLYRALTREAQGVFVRPLGTEQFTPVSLRPLGLESEEELYPAPATLPDGACALIELMMFPEKFLFVEIASMARACSRAGSKIEIIIPLATANEELTSISAANFRLRCTPVVNLFERSLPPIDLEPTDREHRIPGDSKRETVLHSINEIEEWDAQSNQWLALPSWVTVQDEAASWRFVHKPRDQDAETDVYLILSDASWSMHGPAFRSLKVRASCTNGKLAFAEPAGRKLESEDGTVQARLLSSVASPIRPPRGNLTRWLSSGLAEAFAMGQAGQHAFQRLLQQQALLDGDVPRISVPAEERRQRFTRALLQGTRLVEVTRDLCEVPATDRQPGGICQGRQIRIEFDVEHFPGQEVWLYAAVLDRFLEALTPLGQFTRLVVCTRQHGEVYRCPPRFGLCAAL